ALHAGRRNSLLTLGVLAVLTALASSGATASAQSADKKADLETRPEFREPIVLTSTDGVLEVRLTARQGQATLDTVATPVQNFLLRLRGHPRHGIQRAEVGRQSLSSAHSAGISRRKADRPFRKQPDWPDHPRLLHSAIHGQGSACPPLPGADDLVTDKSPH